MNNSFFDFPIYVFKNEDIKHDDLPTPVISEDSRRVKVLLGIICEQPEVAENKSKIGQIMSAIKLDETSYHLMDISHAAEIMKGTYPGFDYSNLLIFGRPPLIQGEIVPFEIHENFQTSHGINAVCTTLLSSLIEETKTGEKEKRLALWNFLKSWTLK